MKRVKKIRICALLISVFILTGCTGKKYYTEEWKISNQEIYDEVFHQYTEYILKVVDSYDLEYTYEIKNSEVNKDTKHIGCGINILFNNKCKITVRFSTDLKSGSMTSRIYFNTKTREETYQINRDYFKILHEINLFSVQGLQGNNYAFEMFLQEAKDSKMQENTYNGRYFYYIEESLDYHGYSLNLVKPSKESNYWRAEYNFNGMLSDKNIIFKNLE